MKRFVALAVVPFWYFLLFTPHSAPSGIRIVMPDQATCQDVADTIALNNPTYGVSACKEASVSPGCHGQGIPSCP